MSRARRALTAFAAAGALALALAGPAVAAPIAQASGCAKATNIEAIIDDSGSMSITDDSRLRVQAMNLLIDTLGPSTQLGAVEFGSGVPEYIPGADTVFPPEPVGANATAMRTALDQKIQADNGATDYNAAFSQSDADNPGADARIFLTDGGHDIGAYNEGHLVHKVPTYVIGFGGIVLPDDQARLKKIASDTGGSYFPLKDSSQLQSVMNSVEAALTCQTPPVQFTDLLKAGQSKPHGVAIGAKTKAVQITLTWANPLDRFKISGLRLTGRKSRLLAVASRKPRKLKVTRKVSSTFAVLTVSGLGKGRLRFSVKATKVGSGAPKASLTTQVSQSSHR